ncbi:MAG: hypothetical protein JRN11_05975 [Nitrososphaerota archaeon]|nr:hypothetical protein [Nitrososphaerota archaeon]MDG7013197.1 hypothetical protein [Nitrososphaerota archaeon]MDG7026278.1 hypothetical protein [Nitrososphaerota archaeon]
MGNLRGLRTRLCPKCQETTPHRTLYVRAKSDGKRRWFQLFWACAKCASLNHIVLPAYRLERASSQLPSALAVAVVNALEEEPLDFDELITSLRRRHPADIRHIFNSEVALAVEFLKGQGIVTEESRDCTEKQLAVLRGRSEESNHLGTCPVEAKRALISLYAQRQEGTARETRLVPVGVLCLRCPYQRINL